MPALTRLHRPSRRWSLTASFHDTEELPGLLVFEQAARQAANTAEDTRLVISIGADVHILGERNGPGLPPTQALGEFDGCFRGFGRLGLVGHQLAASELKALHSVGCGHWSVFPDNRGGDVRVPQPAYTRGSEPPSDLVAFDERRAAKLPLGTNRLDNAAQ